MMLPTLLVVPGIYLKSDIAHRTSISMPADFRLKVLDFYQNNGQFCGICLISPHFRDTSPLLVLVSSHSLH